MPTLTKPKRWNEENTVKHLSKLRFSPTVPCVFTEHGVVMAASVLNSPRAFEVSVFGVRAFVKLRQLVLAHKGLADKLDPLERKVGSHDEAINRIDIGRRFKNDTERLEKLFEIYTEMTLRQASTNKPIKRKTEGADA